MHKRKLLKGREHLGNWKEKTMQGRRSEEAEKAAEVNFLIYRYKHVDVCICWRERVPQEKFTGQEAGKKKNQINT